MTPFLSADEARTKARQMKSLAAITSDPALGRAYLRVAEEFEGLAIAIEAEQNGTGTSHRPSSSRRLRRGDGRSHSEA